MNNTAFNAYDNLANKIHFLSVYSMFVKWFGSAIVNASLAKIPFGDLVELGTREIKNNFTNLDRKGCIVLPNGYECITSHHPQDYSYTKTERVMCHRWIQPYNYQGLTHEKILRPCMLTKYPWMSRFKFLQYQVSTYDKNPEFYVDLGVQINGHTNLYVPYEMFFAGDVEGIVERNRSYLQDYTRGSLVWDEIKCLPIVKKFLTFTALK